MSWYDPIPIKEYRQLNEESGENPPDKSPVSETFAGVDLRVGPILRLAGTFEHDHNYRGSILVGIHGSDVAPEISYQLGPASKHHEKDEQSSFVSGTFESTRFYQQDNISFFRYTVELQLGAYEQKVKYAINKESKSSFQFFIPAVDQSMNVVSYSCNGFSLATPPGDFKSSLWYDVLNKHATQNHYHVMLGGGDQIYADSVKLASSELKKWVEEDNYIKKRKLPATPELKAQLEDYYLHHYLAWFGKGFWKGKNGTTLQSLFPVTMAQIPSVNIFDDHDIIDGFGSYHDYTMNSEVFLAIGNTAYKYYMIFQHHINPEEPAHESDPSWILGKTKGPFIKQKNHSNYLRLGKEIAFLGLDCRTERKLKQVVTPSTYKIVFDRLKKEIEASKGDIKHLLVLLGVPIFYPRLVWVEWILTSPFLRPIRALATKGIINKGLVNEFDGDVELLDDLNDHWCAKHHKKERNQLVQDLIQFGSSHGVRITILSGDVHLGCVGRIKSKFHKHATTHHIIKGKKIEDMNVNVTENPEQDPRLIFNIISSAIINGPPPDGMATLLNKRAYVHHFDSETDEDVIPLFTTDVNGIPRENRRFLNKRNWSDLILAKQSKYHDTIDPAATPENVERKFPQPLSDSDIKPHSPQQADAVHIKYPLFDDSLVTTLHFEKDPSNYDAPTADYEVVIPKLAGHFHLDKTKVKHLK